MKLNNNYRDLKESYLFTDIGRRVAAFQEEHKDVKIIRMGIGDVTLPICRSAVEAMKKASAEMGEAEHFRGYGPEQGYPFLKEKIRDYYAERGVKLKENEIFISDGAKSDLGNILDLFSEDNVVAVPDPVYPVYVDTNIMAGRKIEYLDATAKNGFLPAPDKTTGADLIYICSPNNPTGAAYTREQLAAWVEYALVHDAVILFDAAYEAFVSEDHVARSIYEIDGARECAIEFCSFSKTAGFTGVRCGYTIVPEELEEGGLSLNKMWLRRQTTKFNGVSYIVQRGAEAVFSESGRKEILDNINYYRKNAEVISSTLKDLSIYHTGGKNSPYIWMQCPNGMDSWDFFDRLLKIAGVVGTPGLGFGKNGEGFFRLTAFNTHENTAEAMERLKKLIG